MFKAIWQDLAKWFLAHQRDLPWRQNKTPYRVWISEIMLQQTQVDVVIPYFERWMQTFPSIQGLASAEENEVIKLWEGLGYYSRVRNIHKGAKFLMERYGGEFPSEPSEIAAIPGIGPYTVGAIRAFAFQHRAPAVDGNVMRVIARVLAHRKDVSKEKHKKEIQGLLELHFPDKKPWLITEGLIELGALICKKQPLCKHCPIAGHCKAHSMGVERELPYKPKKVIYERLDRHVGVITSQGKFLVRQCGKGEIMEGLYEFPYMARDEFSIEKFSKSLCLPLDFIKELTTVRHSFTKFRVSLHPSYYASKELRSVKGMEWRSLKELHQLPFSSGHRRVLVQLV